ncbi:MAG: DUF2779 domain-containing protein [Gammaproteobacteria bacterium]
MNERTKVHRKPQLRGLSKSRLMAHRQCPKRLWLATYKAELMDESGAQSAFEFGNQIGDIARQLHPSGHLIEGNNLSEALEATTARLEDRPRKPLFEATFDFQHTLIRADLLLPMRTGYRLVEVKASTSVKPHYIEDVAIQAWVMEKAGVNLPRLELAHVNNRFVYPGGGDYEGLLTYEDVSAETKPLLKEVPRWIEEARETFAGSEPDIAVGPQCKKPYDCPFLDYCSSQLEEVAYPLTDLPHGGNVAKTLTAEGYTDLRDVPAKRLSNAHHLMMHRAVKTGKPIIDPAAGQMLQRLAWPRYYLDFETIQFALPIWIGTRPYQQIPFQWSCHIESRHGEVSHHEFLAEGDGDPRRAFTESLVNTLGATGPIFVYNASFERSRMNELAEAFPEFSAAINAPVARFVDLYPVVRDHYYHPDQHGSWSLKAVLPTIAPELDYAELDVAEGGAAAETFRKLLDPDITAGDTINWRAGLLEYCGRDTLALVRIAHFFQNRSN